MPGCPRIAFTVSLSPCTTLKMPGGSPASIRSSASRTGTEGSRSDGLRIKALPQAIAGMPIQSGIMRGKIERGDARAHAHRLMHRIHVDAGPGAVAEFAFGEMRRCRCRTPPLPVRGESPTESATVLPCSRDISSASGCMFGVEQIDEFHQHPGAALRVGGGPCRLGGGGALYRRVEIGGGCEGDLASTSPVAGLKTSPWRVASPATARPSMKCPILRMASSFESGKAYTARKGPEFKVQV